MDVSRRDFLASGALAVGTTTIASTRPSDANVVLAQASEPVPRGFNPADLALKYDLVIANADLLDPAQQLRGAARHRHQARPDRRARQWEHPGRPQRSATTQVAG
jgi:hypothetical protein